MGQQFASDASDMTFRQAARHALQPQMFLRSAFASAIIWLLMASAMPSYTRLIFHGRLAGYFAAGLAIVLVSEIVTVLITSFFSSDHATLVVMQSPTAVIQGIIAGRVVDALPVDMPPEELFAAVYLIVVLSALLAGGFLVLLGALRAGGLIRYIPYPIVGGFMAGLGWLIFNAGFQVLVDLRLSAASLPLLLEGDIFSRWWPALAFALCILGLRTRVNSTLVMPGAIIASLILFYIWAYFVVGNVNAVAEGGWLLPNLAGALNWQFPDLSILPRIDPVVFAAGAGEIVTLIVVCTLNLFMRASAQEIIVNRELNLNRECIVNGIANAAAVVSGGGYVSYHAPISSSLVTVMRVYGRLVGVILAFMFLLTLAFGSAIFSLIPRFIPAGLLMYFGLQFMKEWLLDSRSSLPRQDYIVVVVIALVTALFGLLAGIAVGIMVAISFFVLQYSRINVIQHELSGAIHRSNLDRPLAQNQLLQKEGDKILIFRLQGFVFFGTAYGFYEHVKGRITSPGARPLAFIILDFKAVRGFDVSAIVDFQKLKRLAAKHNIEILISNVLPDLQPYLVEGGIVEGAAKGLPFFDDLDHALERCENILLERANLLDTAQITVEQQLAQHVRLRRQDTSALRQSLERIETAVGDTVFQQGDDPDALYFIESGRVDVLLEVQPDRVLRLRSMTAGTVIGEVGFYLKTARTAAVVVTEAGVLQRLSHEALRRMEESDPQTASAIHILIASVLSDRLSSSNRLIQELLD